VNLLDTKELPFLGTRDGKAVRYAFPLVNESLSIPFVVAVAIVIFQDGKVLAMRRSQRKDAGPGLWETISGRVERGEEPFQAAYREVLEETGLKVRLDHRPITAYAATRLEQPMVVIVYRAENLSGEVRRSEEHDAHEWLTPEYFGERTKLRKLAKAVHQAARLHNCTC
jgi:8-oxo-dGTP diphosphatase